MSYKTHIALLLGISMLASCKKTEVPTEVNETTVSSPLTNGLPGNFRKIHGYLYASATSNSNTSTFVGYAVFADTSRNLMRNFNHYDEQPVDDANSPDNVNRGNVNVGSVTFSGNNFFTNASSSAWAYSSSSGGIGNVPYNTNWKVFGNKSFRKQDLYINRGFPVVSDTVIKPGFSNTLTISKGYTVSTLASQLGNYDTLIVVLEAQTTPTISIKKTFVPGNLVAFTKQELDTFKTHANDYIIPFIKAYNYSNKTVEGKTYVYELSRELLSQRTLLVKLQ